MVPSHVCQTCGACCAAFRVSFHWLETSQASETGVPVHLVERVDAHRVCLKGTASGTGRCVGLEGRLGERVSCSLYDRRPSPCRDFGDDLERCEHARAKVGLPPLRSAHPDLFGEAVPERSAERRSPGAVRV